MNDAGYMSVGVVLGVVIGLMMDNLAIGMAVGIAIGAGMMGYARRDNDSTRREDQ